MIVKDEENNLPRCLNSIKDIVNEMIIVDTGSSDSTVAIAESFGASVYHFPWNGSFSDARNESLKHARFDWIMIMDADDEMPPENREQILDLTVNDEADAYFFETISYIGEEPGLDVLKNMNLRLMKNHKGYYYSNAIHEQIYCNIKAVNPAAKIVNLNIKVYHYGYLNQNITEHNKRARNIGLLEKELKKKPEHPFTLFNLGSEYYAMGDNVTAIDYFERAYQQFDPNEGFSSHLILKMVHCYNGLGRNEEAIQYSKEGLKVFPYFTDLEFFLGAVEHALGNTILAIRHFDKCIKMGEAPNHLNVIVGAGTYRPHFMMGNIFLESEDYESAALSFENALKLNPQYTKALVLLLKTFCCMKLDANILYKKIEEQRKYYTANYELMVTEVLLQEKIFDTALLYIEKFEKDQGASPYSQYIQGVIQLFLNHKSEAFTLMSSAKNDPEYYVRAVCLQVLCCILNKNFDEADKLLKECQVKDNMITVYNSLLTLFRVGKAPLLSDDVTVSKRYTLIIFDILKIMLFTRELDAFEKTLNLLNCINDKSVLLSLAKLYYQEKCYGLAYRELNRSIKIFDCIDAEGAKMLHKLKLKGI